MNAHLKLESNMKTQYVTRLVKLAPQDYLTVRRLADEKCLAGKGFSAALRMIIREWDILRRAFLQKPSLLSPGVVIPPLSDFSPAPNRFNPSDPCPIDSDPPEIPSPDVPRRSRRT